MDGMDGMQKEDSALRVVLKEQYGLTSLKRDYLLSDPLSGRLEQRDRSARHTSIQQAFRTVFLPQGYPDSVSDDYLQYQIWDTVQAFASSLSGTLATHALLKGMGVGDESATVLAATLTWLLKDGTGMVGRITFAWWKGTQLDCDAKRWRLFADVLNDFAMCLEILAPHAQPYFRPLVCVAGVCKSLVGVAGGCTRAALTQHQARRNNMADVSAKDGSQETVVNLMALVSSLVMLPLVSGQLHLTWALFMLLTALHIFANYRAVKSVCMESLNQSRLQIIMRHYLQTGTVPSVPDVNVQEPVFWGVGGGGWKTELGASVSCVTVSWVSLGQAYQGLASNYLLSLSGRGPGTTVLVVLSPAAATADQLQACVHAELVKFLLTGGRLSEEVRKAVDAVPTARGEDARLLRQTFQATRLIFPPLMAAMRAKGWHPDHCLLGCDEWRATWDFSHLPADRKVV